MPAYLDRSKAHAESGLYFDPPHERCFRLDQCSHVKALKGLGLHEMDFGWWDEAQRAMHLLEVKDYSLPHAHLEGNHLVNECVQKATDCMLLLASIWHDLPYGARIKDCVPDAWHTRPDDPTRLNMFFVFKTPAPDGGTTTKDPIAWDALEAKARDKLKGRRELFHLRTAAEVFLMDHRTAAHRGLPIQTVQGLVGAPATGRSTRKGKRR